MTEKQKKIYLRDIKKKQAARFMGVRRNRIGKRIVSEIYQVLSA